jgi:hypothetical protein
VEHHRDPVSTEVRVPAEPADQSHPARPEQYNESFARGQTELPHDPATQPGPNYARGAAEEQQPHSHEVGRFSRGQEQLPHDHPEKLAEGSFSDGSEQSPTSR